MPKTEDIILAKKEYLEFIKKIKAEVESEQRPKNKYYASRYFQEHHSFYEFHHIFPRSLFPLWISKKSNIIPVTHDEHIYCHRLIERIWPCKQTKCAISFLNTNEIAEQRREKLRQKILENWSNPEKREQILKNRQKVINCRTFEQRRQFRESHREASLLRRQKQTEESKRLQGQKSSQTKLAYFADLEKSKETRKKMRAAKLNMSEKALQLSLKRRRETVSKYTEEEKALHRKNRSEAQKKVSYKTHNDVVEAKRRATRLARTKEQREALRQKNIESHREYRARVKDLFQTFKSKLITKKEHKTSYNTMLVALKGQTILELSNEQIEEILKQKEVLI